jgi:hypothetical protein
VVELPALRYRLPEDGRDRVGVDGSSKRLAITQVDAGWPARTLHLPGPQMRGTGGTRNLFNWMIRLPRPEPPAVRNLRFEHKTFSSSGQGKWTNALTHRVSAWSNIYQTSSLKSRYSRIISKSFRFVVITRAPFARAVNAINTSKCRSRSFPGSRPLSSWISASRWPDSIQ